MHDDELDKQFEEAIKIENDIPDEPLEDKSREDPKEADESKKDDEQTDDSGDNKPSESGDEKDEDGEPEKPSEDLDSSKDDKPAEKEEEPRGPLTKDDIEEVITRVRTEERTSVKEIESTTDEVLNAYYPEGLSNVLIDEQSGKEIRSPQDVVDLSGGSMSIEDATKWLMNEQFKLDEKVSEIKDSARKIAETTIQFRKDGTNVIERYNPLFDAYPGLQRKVYDIYMQNVKADADKGVILSAPDMQQFYDTFLEPYKTEFEKNTQQPATTSTEKTEKSEPPKQTVDDRLDVAGDGDDAGSDLDDPNDFAQQIKKEFSKGAW